MNPSYGKPDSPYPLDVVVCLLCFLPATTLLLLSFTYVTPVRTIMNMTLSWYAVYFLVQ